MSLHRPLLNAASVVLLLTPIAGVASAGLPSLAEPAAARISDAKAALAPIGRAPRPPVASVSSLDGVWRPIGALQVTNPFLVYDGVHDHLLSILGIPNQDWTLPLTGPAVWEPLPQPAGLTGGGSVGAVWDPATGRVCLSSFGATSTEILTLDPMTGSVMPIAASGTAPQLVYSSMVFDAVNQRLLLLGGLTVEYGLPTDEVWALDLLPTPSWSQWTPAGTPPPETYIPKVVLDPSRRRVLLPSLATGGPVDIWSLNLDGPPEWSHGSTNGLPDGPTPNPVIYDPTGDLFWTVDGAGRAFSLSPETFQWSQASASGPGPAPRQLAGLVLDPLRHRLLLAGGEAPAGDDTHSDTRALALDGSPAWVNLVPDPVRPPVRGGASDGYDDARHRLVVFGGSDQHGGFRNDTWALDLAPTPEWSPVATEGGPPAARYWHASAWDDAHDRLVVYGGYDGDQNNPLGDLWSLSFAGGLPTWTPIATTGAAPDPRFLTQMIYDPIRDRFLVMLGEGATQLLGDVWELRLDPAPTWRLLAPTGPTPAPRGAEMCVYDPVRDRVLMFGGGNTQGMLGDLWALDLAVGDGAWNAISAGAGPSPRNLGLARYDSVHDRLLLFGGYGVTLSIPHYTEINYLNDAWALDLAGTPTWRQLVPSGPVPAPRDRADGTYDRIHDRLIVTCGGIDASNDTWALEFSDQATPTLLTLARSEVTSDRVLLEWAGARPGSSVNVYRRAGTSSWRMLGASTADGEGHVIYQDRSVAPGEILGYRLGVMTDTGEQFVGETQVTVPVPALAMTARAPDGRVTFSLQLVSNAAASLELFDLAGRRLWSQSVGQLGAGTHQVSADGVRLPAALYFARLTQGREIRFARVVVVR